MELSVSTLDVPSKINGRITISNAEILQCHTFTKCVVCIVVPPDYSIGDLCSPPESYQIQSCIGLGNIIRNTADPDPQAYSGVSAIGPNPTREASLASGSTQAGASNPDEGHIQAGDFQDGRISPTLTWPTKLPDDTAPVSRTNQHPIAPTKKKERPTARPSCKGEAVPKHTQQAPLAPEQDVDMPDVSSKNLLGQGLETDLGASSSKDPIESYSSAKPNNDDMEVDSDGDNPGNSLPMQSGNVHKESERKSTTETIAAIASPQKPRPGLRRPLSPRTLPKPAAKNGNTHRPPGITILQHSAILAKGREKNEQAGGIVLDPRNCSKAGKQLDKLSHPATRAKGVSNPKVSAFFQKAVETPIQSHPHELDELERGTREEIVIDVEQDNLEKMLVEENIMKQSIREANMKWHANEEEEFRLPAGSYALDFLKSMNGTLCYLIVAFRMLAKAPWTIRMVCVHIRQAAIYAISQGWFVNTLISHGIHFSRAELALAAGTFLGDLTPNLPDDTEQPLFLLIQELPHICAELFSVGSAVCKYCGGSKNVPIPTFATELSWTSPSWKSLRHCLEHDCTPFPWITNPGDRSWHESNCSRDDIDIVDVKIGPWAYVSFRGDDVDAFPHFSTIAETLKDISLSHHGLTVKATAMVCSNVQESKARHFWLLEIEKNKPVGLYDSLHGLMPVTLETAKKLKVTGFLLVKSQTHCPVLKSKELELVAGKPIRKERRSVPIAVRSRSAWLRTTQQHGVGSSTKVKKTSTKRTVTESVSLGRFFDNTKLQSRARPKPKAKGFASTQDRDAAIFSPGAHYEDRTRVAAVPEYDSSVVGDDTWSRNFQLLALRPHLINQYSSKLSAVLTYLPLLILTRLCPEAMRPLQGSWGGCPLRS